LRALVSAPRADIPGALETNRCGGGARIALHTQAAAIGSQKEADKPIMLRNTEKQAVADRCIRLYSDSARLCAGQPPRHEPGAILCRIGKTVEPGCGLSGDRLACRRKRTDPTEVASFYTP
jgi:hypothetical protein